MTEPAKNVLAHPAAAAEAAKAPPRSNRLRLFGGLVMVLAIAGGGYGTWYALVGSKRVSTDNAYVAADTAMVTPLVGGPVKEVRVADTQVVKKGDVLVVLDDTDARIAVAQAEAALAQAQRRVQGYLANDTALAAQITARSADTAQAAAQVASARSSFARAKVDLDRRTALAASGAVSGDELTAAQNAYSTAEANLAAAQAAQAQAVATRAAAVGSLNANETLTRGTTIAGNPEVAVAQAKLEQAKVDLERMVIRAPLDGVVARRAVQVGQRVAAGSQLMMVVPVQQAYVDANFKEVQLGQVRPGQSAELEADLYGSKVKYHGKVVGLGGGTGSTFAVIPAQNATGNWIKVVQRVPVRIALDPAELKAHPLRPGLSMKAVINLAGA